MPDDTPPNPPRRRPPMGREDRLTVRVPPAMLADFQNVATLRYCDMTGLIRARLAHEAMSHPGPGYLPRPLTAPDYSRPGWDARATAQLQMRLPRVLIDALDALAEASGVPRSTIVRWLIAEYVESFFNTIDLMTRIEANE